MVISRARNLYKGIQHVYHALEGKLPQTFAELKTIPGLGDYSAAAVASIAFDEKVLAIDVNVARVFARFFCIDQTGEALRNRIKELVSEQIPKRAGDFTQACIELGGVICRAKNPKCLICPINETCMAYKQNYVDQYPKKIKEKARQYRLAQFYRIYNESGQLLLWKRPAKGLLASLYVLPSNDWYGDGTIGSVIEDIQHQSEYLYAFTHIFTHIHLSADVYTYKSGKGDLFDMGNCIWVDPNMLDQFALPIVVKKAMKDI